MWALTECRDVSSRRVKEMDLVLQARWLTCLTPSFLAMELLSREEVWSQFASGTSRRAAAVFFYNLVFLQFALGSRDKGKFGSKTRLSEAS